MITYHVIYLIVFLAALVTDFIPVIAPPAWAVMAFLLMKFDLHLLPVLLTGVAGSTLARYLQSVYMPRIAGSFLKRTKQEDLEFLGKKLRQTGWHRWLFVFFYTMSPFPATLLFTAAGMAKVNSRQTILPFFCGRFVGDAVLILAVQSAVGNIRNFRHGTTSSVGILSAGIGLVVLFAVLFIDWRELLHVNRFRFRFAIWK